MTYAEQLKDPRWQKKRLEIMDRDEWTCQVCGDTSATLTVHHKSYKMDEGVFADVWDYEDNDLITLCEECHVFEEEYLKELQKKAFFVLRAGCKNAEAIDQLLYEVGEFASKNRRLAVYDLLRLSARLKNDLT